MASQQQSSTRIVTTVDNNPRRPPQKRPALPLLLRNSRTGKYTSIASAHQGKLLNMELSHAARLKEASYSTATKQLTTKAGPSSDRPIATIPMLDINNRTPNKATESDPLGLQTGKQVAAWGSFTVNKQSRTRYGIPTTKVTKTGRVMCEGNQFSHGKAYRCEKVAPKEKRSGAFVNAMKGRR